MKRTYHEDLIKDLTNPDYALVYLNTALEQKDMPSVFLLALKNVVEAYGVTKLSKKTKLNRVNMYRMLSKSGNPELKSLQKILDSLNLKIVLDKKAA